jgi:hypothetical protein
MRKNHEFPLITSILKQHYIVHSYFLISICGITFSSSENLPHISLHILNLFGLSPCTSAVCLLRHPLPMLELWLSTLRCFPAGQSFSYYLGPNTQCQTTTNLHGYLIRETMKATSHCTLRNSLCLLPKGFVGNCSRGKVTGKDKEKEVLFSLLLLSQLSLKFHIVPMAFIVLCHSSFNVPWITLNHGHWCIWGHWSWVTLGKGSSFMPRI